MAVLSPAWRAFLGQATLAVRAPEVASGVPHPGGYRRSRDLNFNTGRNDVDKDPGGKAFKCVDFLDRLAEAGYEDAWRAVHPTRRESTWKSRSGGKELRGFRLDHVFISAALSIGIYSAHHVHRVRGLVRNGGLSDHSIVIVDLDLSIMALPLTA